MEFRMSVKRVRYEGETYILVAVEADEVPDKNLFYAIRKDFNSYPFDTEIRYMIAYRGYKEKDVTKVKYFKPEEVKKLEQLPVTKEEETLYLLKFQMTGINVIPEIEVGKTYVIEQRSEKHFICMPDFLELFNVGYLNKLQAPMSFGFKIEKDEIQLYLIYQNTLLVQKTLNPRSSTFEKELYFLFKDTGYIQAKEIKLSTTKRKVSFYKKENLVEEMANRIRDEGGLFGYAFLLSRGVRKRDLRFASMSDLVATETYKDLGLTLNKSLCMEDVERLRKMFTKSLYKVLKDKMLDKKLSTFIKNTKGEELTKDVFILYGIKVVKENGLYYVFSGQKLGFMPSYKSIEDLLEAFDKDYNGGFFEFGMINIIIDTLGNKNNLVVRECNDRVKSIYE